jgi:hypothetical protein
MPLTSSIRNPLNLLTMALCRIGTGMELQQLLFNILLIQGKKDPLYGADPL